ncbi:hypothetical protein LIER_13171 [Lithospermum erythrorhizon]|uniref:RNA-directed DNA polymerase (Reverse transcriptase) n=1 Tax=Lithospermum erythrorhizon TaxID=34254 RepID=A0AAV3PUP4_LITER
MMIKSVTTAIPNFVMNCFKLPAGIIDDLNRTMARFLWANGEGEKGWRVATQEASLLFKLPRTSFLGAKLGANPSYG